MSFRDNIKLYEQFEAVELATGNKVRCKLEDNGNVFVFLKGKRKYGHRFTDDTFLQFYSPKFVNNTTREIEWHKRCATVEKHLTKSGLWVELCEVFHNLQKISYSDWKTLKTISVNDVSQKQLIDKYKQQYPFVFTKSGNINTDYIYEISEARTKTMNFGRANTQYKASIMEHMHNHQDYKFRTRVNYDVSFSYSAEQNKAWYSEEYRNCGNGHYYIALDNSMALFVEDD